MTIESKRELGILLQRHGFRIKKDNEGIRQLAYPTQKQLNGAWEYLKSIEQKQKTISFDRYKIEKYDKHEIMRANRDFVYKKKNYRKGQFLPKSLKGR